MKKTLHLFLILSLLLVTHTGALGGGALASSSALGQPEASEIITQVQNYLTNLTTFTSHISQHNPDGQHVKGRIFMNRQVATTYGKLRLEYNPPEKNLVIVDGERFILQDLTTNERNNYDVSQTPAGFLLKKQIRFGDDILVKNVAATASQITITLVGVGDQNGMSLTLSFNRQPFLILKEWVVVDPQGNRTMVELSDVRIGMPLDDDLFHP